MTIVKGTICSRGLGHMSRRMCEYADVFERATGERLIKGTINVDVGEEITINEDFRIRGSEINEPDQDLLFERCRINGFRAYRIRPLDAMGKGGWGDHIIEITCSEEIRPNSPGTQVEIAFFPMDQR
jgi:hypothetical protein